MKITIDTVAGTLEEHAEGEVRRWPLYSKEAFEVLSQEWIRVGWSQSYFATFTWLGRPIYQLPDDVLRIQEVVAQLQPDLIIETGIARGGSLLFYASLCSCSIAGGLSGSISRSSTIRGRRSSRTPSRRGSR